MQVRFGGDDLSVFTVYHQFFMKFRVDKGLFAVIY